jgi:GT2 family glycosyltransferase
VSRTTAIIVSRDSGSDTQRAIESLLGTSDAPAIVVVDCGSTDSEEPATLARRFPSINVIALAEDVGFARAVNLGANRAIERGSKYVLLFDRDAWLLPRSRTLERLEAALDADPQIDAAGPQILNPDGSTHSLGYRYSLWWPIARPCTSISQPTGFLGKSCLLLRASTFALIGGLDPDYMSYGDDADYALRLAGQSRRIAFVGGAAVLKKRSAGDPAYGPGNVYAALRSSLILVRKHCRPVHLPTALAALVALSFALTALGVRKGYARTLRAVMRAWFDVARDFQRDRLRPSRSARPSSTRSRPTVVNVR